MVFWDDIVTKYDGFLPESQKGSLMDFIRGEKQFSFNEWFQRDVKICISRVTCEWKITRFSYFADNFQYVFAGTTKCI